jgi:hypothetical protein
MTQTFTQKHKAKLEQYLATHTLPKGLGTKESACSIAAINLALSGTLADDIPDCMSDVLGKATIRLQDAMPGEMRNSERYKALLPEMAGTGREHEQERRTIIMDWMWSVVLPQLQPLADKHGFGDAWKNMCQLKTHAAAESQLSILPYLAHSQTTFQTACLMFWAKPPSGCKIQCQRKCGIACDTKPYCLIWLEQGVSMSRNV